MLSLDATLATVVTTLDQFATFSCTHCRPHLALSYLLIAHYSLALSRVYYRLWRESRQARQGNSIRQSHKLRRTFTRRVEKFRGRPRIFGGSTNQNTSLPSRIPIWKAVDTDESSGQGSISLLVATARNTREISTVPYYYDGSSSAAPEQAVANDVYIFAAARPPGTLFTSLTTCSSLSRTSLFT